MPWVWPIWSPEKQVTPKELAQTAAQAIETANPTLKAVVETYPDRIDDLDETSLGDGPFRGVPFLIKDVFGHEAGRKIEFGSPPLRRHDRGNRHLFRRSAQGLRRQHPRPLGGARIFHVGDHRERHVRQHVEPMEAGLLGRRLDRRRTGGRDLRHGADRARLRHRRLDPHPGELVRRRRPEALARPRLDRPGGRRGRLRLLDEFHPGQDRARRGGHARLRLASADRRSLHHPEARGALRDACAQEAPASSGSASC